MDADSQPSRTHLERAFVEYCHLSLHQPVKTFSSDGQEVTGEETGYRRMMEFMRESAGQYLVVVPGAGHLGADLEAVARSVVELDRVGAEVICSDEEFPDVFQNAFQTLGIKGVSRTRSRRIRESMRARALQGQAMGRPVFGYRIGRSGTLEVVREEAAVVERIYGLYTRDGLGLRLIARQLNQQGITTRRGGRWSVVSVRDVLKNPAYTGTYTRFGMRRPRAHEAIISSEVFRAARDRARTRRPVGRVATSEPFLLSGMMHCGYCGAKMMGVTRRQSWKRKDGRRASAVYRYYQCQSRNNQSLCGYHTWRAPVLESAILIQLRRALLAEGSVAANGGEDNPSLREAARAVSDARVVNAERRLLQAMKRAARGDIRAKLLGGYLKELDTARQSASTAGRPVDVAVALSRWESLDMDERRSFLAAHVTRIVAKDEAGEVAV